MPRGYALILSQEKFNDQLPLPGVIKDEIALKNTLNSLNIYTQVLRDGTKDEIRQKIHEISWRDFSSEKYLIVSILSHGDENNVICAKDGKYNLMDFIVSPICENRTLAGKPKIFLVDACKGGSDFIFPVLARKGGNDLSTRSRGTGCVSDVFVFYATKEKYVSREYLNGSGGYFTQNFCKVIQMYAKTATFLKIVNIVKDLVYTQSCRERHPQLATSDKGNSRDFYL